MFYLVFIVLFYLFFFKFYLQIKSNKKLFLVLPVPGGPVAMGPGGHILLCCSVVSGGDLGLLVRRRHEPPVRPTHL